MWSLFSLVLILSMQMSEVDPLAGERAKITIINAVPLQRSENFKSNGGPSLGDMLDAHFFPAVKYFNQGMYLLAIDDLNYTINRPTYLDMNSRQAEYLSTAHYLRGLIYLYHADGLGRHSLARADFGDSIKWNPNNHVAYLELSRVYSEIGLKDAAISLLQALQKLKLDESIAQQVEVDVNKLTGALSPRVSIPAATPIIPASTAVSSATAPASLSVREDPAPADSVKPANPPEPPVDASASALMGRIAVNSTPSAEVYLEGRHLGSTPLTLEFKQGEYTLEYRHLHLTQSMTHVVKANETSVAVVSFDLILDVNAKPWAEVLVEGSSASLGETPLTGVRVPIGTSLVFRNPAFPEKRYKVQTNDRLIGIEFP